MRTYAAMIVTVSGYSDDAILGEGVLGPEASLLLKPFSPMNLVRRMREVLDPQS